MKFKEINEKKENELESLEGKIRKELSEVRMAARSGGLPNTSKIGHLRRDIARILTVQQQRTSKKTKTNEVA